MCVCVYVCAIGIAIGILGFVFIVYAGAGPCTGPDLAVLFEDFAACDLPRGTQTCNSEKLPLFGMSAAGFAMFVLGVAGLVVVFVTRMVRNDDGKDQGKVVRDIFLSSASVVLFLVPSFVMLGLWSTHGVCGSSGTVCQDLTTVCGEFVCLTPELSVPYADVIPGPICPDFRAVNVVAVAGVCARLQSLR